MWAGGVPQGSWSGIEWDPDCTGAKSYIHAAVAAGQVPQVLAYSIPGRDLGQFSTGGAVGRAAYEAWIGQLSAAIGTHRVILAYEPDSLTQADGLEADSRAGRIATMISAIKRSRR